MAKPKILIQIDSDKHPSSFDRVVAVDAGVDHLSSYGGVTVDDVETLVHGAMFTRGPDDLHQTAIFIGGSNVATGEAMLEKVQKTFFGPLTVSVMMDANGANTTAAAAVLSAGKHLGLSSATALVLGGTGPVGQRAARLLAAEGATVRLASRSASRATDAAKAINEAVPGGKVDPVQIKDEFNLADALDGAQVVIAAGAPGVTLMPEKARKDATALKVAIDLNAVPPMGIEGVGATDKAAEIDGVTCYGAIGVGGLKMKIHKAAIRQLFDANNQVLDADAVYTLGKSI